MLTVTPPTKKYFHRFLTIMIRKRMISSGGKVTYTQKELSDLVKTRTGIDFGIITDLEPLERGVSGRITRLKIAGTTKTMIIGKELEIRKSLSKSHLYSSCFFVEKIINHDGTRFVFHGPDGDMVSDYVR